VHHCAVERMHISVNLFFSSIHMCIWSLQRKICIQVQLRVMVRWISIFMLLSQSLCIYCIGLLCTYRSLSIMCHEWLLNLCIWMFAKIGAEDIPVPYCSFPSCDWLLDEMGSCKPAPWSRWGDCRCRTFWIEVCSDDIGDWFFQGVRISCKKGRRSHNPRRLRCSSVGVGICHT